MANPAPTINQINAFNATQGTTIDFNIIGGTELVRSNRIYIYDLSDNSLICTHLYVSTESIHELPANTDSSIVYESGKSSADFVNGAQYYAQIQTYTDTAGTEGGSGLSVAKMFWCLVDPTLTITTIPSTISTTSYNVSATYDANTSVVSNIIQQYQFSLYSATGSLLQSSGVVVGSGAQQGTSTAYDISYNFTGLSVGSSYYVVVDVTTTQGMSVSTQSGTFTVSIDTPTLGEATVVNNACDGYISVTSNLSGEYGGSASGEVATFVTDSVNDVSSLKVTLEPQQDDTPWVHDDNESVPYTFRASASAVSEVGNRITDKIVGGTVNWNQHFPPRTVNYTGEGYTLVSNNDGEYTLNVTTNGASESDAKNHTYIYSSEFVANHKYAFYTDNNKIKAYLKSNDKETDSIIMIITPSYNNVSFMFGSLAVGTYKFHVNLIDLTAMFGTTIADYIYSLEQATAGAGVAWFRKYFPNSYYANNAGELLSVSGLSSHDMVGFNVYNPQNATRGKRFGGSGQQLVDRASSSVSDYVSVIPNSQYYAKDVSGSSVGNSIVFYNSDKTWIGTVDIGYGSTKESGAFTTPNGCAYIRFQYETANESGVCINLSKTTGSPKNGDYVAYEKYSYALDDSLTLNGVFQLENGELKAYGDVYPSSGQVDRKFGLLDLGTLNWQAISGYAGYFMAVTTDIVNVSNAVLANALCSKYVTVKGNELASKDKAIAVGMNNAYQIQISDSAYSSASASDFKSAMSGVMLLYERRVPITEPATAYTNPQIVDPDGTEEYVTTSIVPVGHETDHSLVCPIGGYDSVSANVVGKNLFNESAEPLFINVYNASGVLVGPNKAYKFTLTAGAYTVSTAWRGSKDAYIYLNLVNADGTLSKFEYLATANDDRPPMTMNVTDGQSIIIWDAQASTAGSATKFDHLDIQLELGSTATAYEPYQGQTYTTDLGQTVYGGTVDLASGVLTLDRAVVTLDGTRTSPRFGEVSQATTADGTMYIAYINHTAFGMVNNDVNTISDKYAFKDLQLNNLHVGEFNAKGTYTRFVLADQGITTLNALNEYLADNPIQLVYSLVTPQTYQLTPQDIQTLVGTNNVWSEQGNIELSYHIPITNLLVKRQDVADVSGTWLTLYSQPITQASDMDFTFIDFLNQYGKTYKYALVPLLNQTQSGVEVEVEGGYTVSDEVQSIFDGVFIADATGSQKCKANVGYGDVDMNQAVGTITPIGSKYPVVITNSKNQYHNGSISGTIVPDDYYFNGNLSRIDMVNKRNELEQFLTNKRAKIIKDWNSNIWLVMIMDNISCSFDNTYGMGIVTFNANWIEVGDPTNQEDLQATGLIDVGGV